MKNLCLFICITLVLYFISTDTLYGLTDANCDVFSNRVRYLLQHANVTHITINIYSFLVLCFLCRIKIWQFVSSLIIAITLPSIFLTSVPIVGFSTVIYAITGIIIMNSKKWWWLFGINLLFIGAGMVMPGIAFIAHLYCFIMGVAIGFLTGERYDRR